MQMKLIKPLFLFLFCIFILCGCSDDSDNPVGAEQSDSASTASAVITYRDIVINHLLRGRAVADNIDYLECSCYNQYGYLVYGPVKKAKSDKVVFHKVPSNAYSVCIRYINGYDKVRGYYSEKISNFGEDDYEINNPEWEDIFSVSNMDSIVVPFMGSNNIKVGNNIRVITLARLLSDDNIVYLQDITDLCEYSSDNDEILRHGSGAWFSAVKAGEANAWSKFNGLRACYSFRVIEDEDEEDEEESDTDDDADADADTDGDTDADTDSDVDDPIDDPTFEPTAEPTETPSDDPTHEPTAEPTETPSDDPTHEPTAEPTETPSDDPTYEPTAEPTETPSDNETEDLPENTSTYFSGFDIELTLDHLNEGPLGSKKGLLKEMISLNFIGSDYCEYYLGYDMGSILSYKELERLKRAGSDLWKQYVDGKNGYWYSCFWYPNGGKWSTSGWPTDEPLSGDKTLRCTATYKFLRGYYIKARLNSSYEQASLGDFKSYIEDRGGKLEIVRYILDKNGERKPVYRDRIYFPYTMSVDSIKKKIEDLKVRHTIVNGDVPFLEHDGVIREYFTTETCDISGLQSNIRKERGGVGASRGFNDVFYVLEDNKGKKWTVESVSDIEKVLGKHTYLLSNGSIRYFPVTAYCAYNTSINSRREVSMSARTFTPVMLHQDGYTWPSCTFGEKRVKIVVE